MKLKTILQFGAAAGCLGLLSGCWTPPSANVQPQGEPRLIQGGITVESDGNAVTVQSVDSANRTIVLKLADGGTATCKAGPKVKNFDQLQAGVKATADLTKELDVYLLANGRLLDGTTAETLGVNARVLQVDPSYRLLTLQYPDGQSEIVKPGLNAKMEQMAPGDSVVVRPVAVTAIKVVN
ncbi:MAG TPA: hypothetical protein VFY06_00275 [Verrucomicrobiae bacterium]|nr:hypothetical protein [Verrucomicrobiae bacterium]